MIRFQQASRMSLRHIDMDSTQTEVKAMDDLREKIEKVYSDENLAFPYSRFYLGWETNKVLDIHSESPYYFLDTCYRTSGENLLNHPGIHLSQSGDLVKLQGEITDMWLIMILCHAVEGRLYLLILRK